MSPDRHSLEEVWNSGEMRQIRKDMVEGRKVSGCEECYQNEQMGGTSMRVRDNASWDAGWLNEERTSVESLMQVAVDNDFRLPFLPVSIEVDTGSICNLKCRMCHGDVSSRIAADPVHGTWALDAFTGAAHHDETLKPRQPHVVRFPSKSFINDVGSYVDQLKRFYLIGGEPTLVREVHEIIQQLVESGHASHIELAMVSNGTITKSWLDLVKDFRVTQLSLSIDGFDEIYDYIRYPFSWKKLQKNIEIFQASPYINLGASVTLQVNNALNVTKLFRYFDSAGIGFYCYPIYGPRHLSIWTLPAGVRKLASERLQEYGETDCLPQHRDMVLGLARQLASGSDDAFDPRLVREFMMFTNDLDVTRRQSIHRVDPELVALLEQEGFPWIQETLHAGQHFPLSPRKATNHEVDLTTAAVVGREEAQVL